MSDLKKIIDQTASRLGVSLAFYPENERCENVPFCDKPFEESTDDGTHTFFRFSYKNAGYIGVIFGVGDLQRNYASLLPAYLESFTDRETPLFKTDYLKRILLGEGTSLGAYKYATKFSLLGCACYALVIRLDKCMQETLAVIEQYGGNSLDTAVQMEENVCVLVKFLLGKDSEETSPVDYAEFLVQSLQEELGLHAKVGVGPIVRDVKDVAFSYIRAENALRYASVFEIAGNVHSYREFILMKVLEETPRNKLEEYFAEFTDESFKEILSDDEMLETAEAFLKNDLNVSETSRNLYMHRNTLLYRLDKIEAATGLNIRVFSDAVSFQVLTSIYKLLNQ